MIDNKYNVLDLFCGCGGLSKGFEMAGYNVILGIDNDDAALNTFKKNHKNSVTLNADLSNAETFTKIEELIGNKKIDVIVGGPPCQGFSLSGPRNFDDERNKLYLAMIKTVEIFKPTAFVIENVPGMAKLYGGEIHNEIKRRFKDLGYAVNSDILCAADYGVPQIRKRLIIVGIKDGDPFDFEKLERLAPEHYVTCEQAISDLPSLTNNTGKEKCKYTHKANSAYQAELRGKCNFLYNHIATNHTKEVKQVISLVPEGGNYKDLPQGVGTSRKFNEAWTRYHSKKPSRTIDTGHRNHFHYKWNRVPTVRENARLQSFPDDFIFYGNKTQQYRQVGNAVPPKLGNAIAKDLTLYIVKKGKNEKD